MGHERIAPIALAGALIASSALAEAPTAQRQTPDKSARVGTPGAPTSASPAPGGAATSVVNRPGGTASQAGTAALPVSSVVGDGRLDAGAVRSRVGTGGGAALGPPVAGPQALPDRPSGQDRAAGTNRPGSGRAVAPTDLSREAPLRQLGDPRGGLSTSATSPAAAAGGGLSAADLVTSAGATPPPGAGKNAVSRQGQLSSETTDATKEQVRNALFPQGLSGQTIESVVGGGYRALEKAAIESGWSKKYDDGRPNYAVGVRGRPDPGGPVRSEGHPVPAVDAGRTPFTAADAAKRGQVAQPAEDGRRAVERMVPTPEARRDMVQPNSTRTNPVDGRSGDGTTPSPGGGKSGGSPPPGGKAPEQVDQTRPGTKPGRKPDDPAGG